MSENKPNYIGSVFYNEYNNEFTGYSVYLSQAEIADAFKRFTNKDGKIRINIKPGRDPKKPYALVHDFNAQKPVSTQQRAQTTTQEMNDIPF